MSILPHVFFASCCILLSPSPSVSSPDDGQQRRDPRIDALERSVTRIKKIFGVRVHYSYDFDTYFPDDWKKAPFSADGRQIDLDQAGRTMPIIEAFLSKYSTHVLSGNLRDIFLLSHLSFHGREYGATNSGAGVYVTNSGENDGYTSEFLEAMMHAEFSSILYRNYSFPSKKWGQVNEKGWEYVGFGKDYELLTRGDLLDHREDLLKKGFLTVYAQTSIEEDFNMYIHYLFERPSWLADAASRHDRIWQKLQIVVEFYKTIGSALPFGGGPGLSRPSRVEKSTNGSGAGGNLSQKNVTLVDLPAAVFVPAPGEKIMVTIHGKSTISIKGQTAIAVTGSTTIRISDPGPITITVLPNPGPD